MLDIVIQPFYNKMPQVMKLYDKLIKQIVDGVSIIIVNNGSVDGMRPSNFHKDEYIKYVSSETKMNDSLLLSHAILRESNNKYVNLISYQAEIDDNYISNLVNFLDDRNEDIVLGGIESSKSRRSTIRISDRRETNNIKVPDSFFFENIIFKRETIMKAGLFDKDLKTLPNSTKFLCYHMIKSFNATYVVNKTSSILLQRFPDESSNSVLNKNIIDYDSYKYTFKNYIDKNVYKLARGVDEDRIYHAPINVFIILPTKNNDRLEDLIRRQKAKGDKLYISNLPKYMAKRLGYIFQKYTEFDSTVVIHENAPFNHPYFIDDFKKCSVEDESVIWTSDGDFRTFDLRPSNAATNMSICVPRMFLWEPGLNETMNWDEFIRKMSELQPDQRISDLFKPPKKTEIKNTSGDGGPVKTVPIPRKHKTSWYDWMED